MNILLLPLVPYVMGLIFFSALGFFLLPGLHVIPASIAYVLLRVITSAVEQLSRVSGTVPTGSFHPSILFLWYACLFFGIVILQKYFFQKNVQTHSLE